MVFRAVVLPRSCFPGTQNLKSTQSLHLSTVFLDQNSFTIPNTWIHKRESPTQYCSRRSCIPPSQCMYVCGRVHFYAASLQSGRLGMYFMQYVHKHLVAPVCSSPDNVIWRSLSDLHSAACLVGTVALGCSLFAYAKSNILHEEEGR